MGHLFSWGRAWGILLLVPLISCTSAKIKNAVPTEPTDVIDDDIQQLATPEGKIEHVLPWVVPSEPMKRLIARGRTIQPRLLQALKDSRIQNEVVLILEEVGDKDAISPLIELLPTKGELKEDEEYAATCLLRSLNHLTGQWIGYNPKWPKVYTPDVRKKWQAWYGSNKDYLHTPSKPPTTTSGGSPAVRVDFEAKLATVPTVEFRKAHPWIHFDDIKTWQSDAAYVKKLRDYCFTTILNTEYGRGCVHALGFIDDPRAIALLHRMCEMEDFTTADHDLLDALADKGDPSSIRYLEKLKPSTDIPANKDHDEKYRTRTIEALRLLEKHRPALKGKPLGNQEQVNYMRCLEGTEGVERLVSELRNRDHDCFFASYARVASYVDKGPVRTCLAETARDETRSESVQTMAHAALARLGEKGSLEHLRRSLAHKHPGVRLAAAEGLWRLGNREGYKTLIVLLEVRPIETGGEGVSVRPGHFKVESIKEPNVEIVRSACRILGEMGDPTAIEPLKRVLSINLNGINGNNIGSGCGWSGRPDVVALARLGDLSGLPVLRAAVSDGDRLGVIGDYVAIGLKRYIPDILPLLEDRAESKRIDAAKDIILLLEKGR